MVTAFKEIDSEIRKIRVVIMAGGSGKRMNIDKPKALLELSDGYTLLDREIEFYFNCGFKNFVFILGKYADQIIEHIENKKYKEKINYEISIDPKTDNWGKGKALKYAFETGVLKRERIIITFPDDLKLDNFLPIKLLLTHLEANRRYGILGTIVLTNGSEFPFGVAKVENNFVVDFVEKPLMNVFVSIGMYLLEKEVTDMIDDYIDLEEPKAIEFEEIILPMLSKEKKLYSMFVSHDIWLPINDMKIYEKARNLFKKAQSSLVF
ncbi:MAG: sugar phosphate nucleotidyltransferase [Candidatus Aenigmatarchaeota archaeon]